MSYKNYPQGFLSYVINAGIANKEDDLVVVFSTTECTACALFTKNLIPGAAVTISKQNIVHGKAQALVVISKNANVATGKNGYKNAEQIVNIVSKKLNISPNLIQIGSTGVIGKPYPMDKITAGLAPLDKQLSEADFLKVANGIKTTDKHPKIYSKKIGAINLVGVAKGVGMIEPNMATLLTYFFTDADINKKELELIFARVINKTFNCISIDSDTSTSDSAVIFANGLAGKVDLIAFETALYDISLQLITDILKDGEGSSKIMKVQVNSAKDYAQAKLIGKSIINSPLVKTAIHGADANWGRIMMAIGKCTTQTDIKEHNIIIKICQFEVYPQLLDEQNLAKLTKLMQNDTIDIEIVLNTGKHKATVWGCDLTPEYVKFNSDYLT